MTSIPTGKPTLAYFTWAFIVTALGLALGAWLGGMVISMGYGYGATGYVGSALSLAGLIIFLISVALEKKPSRG